MHLFYIVIQITDLSSLSILNKTFITQIMQSFSEKYEL